MYKCSVCNNGVIVVKGEVFRVCPKECVEAAIIADASMSMKGVGGLSN